MSRVQIPHKYFRWDLSSLLPVLLLAVYVIGSIGLDFAHQAIHDHSTSANTVTLKQCSPHQEKQTHIYAAGKCKCSHVVFNVNQLCISNDVTLKASQAKLTFYNRISSVLLTGSFTSLLRAHRWPSIIRYSVNIYRSLVSDVSETALSFLRHDH